MRAREVERRKKNLVRAWEARTCKQMLIQLTPQEWHVAVWAVGGRVGAVLFMLVAGT